MQHVKAARMADVPVDLPQRILHKVLHAARALQQVRPSRFDVSPSLPPIASLLRISRSVQGQRPELFQQLVKFVQIRRGVRPATAVSNSVKDQRKSLGIDREGMIEVTQNDALVLQLKSKLAFFQYLAILCSQ